MDVGYKGCLKELAEIANGQCLTNPAEESQTEECNGGKSIKLLDFSKSNIRQLMDFYQSIIKNYFANENILGED